MSNYTREQRAVLRKQDAAERAQRKRQQDPYWRTHQRVLRRVEEHVYPASRAAVAAALHAQHKESGEHGIVMIGVGDGTEAERAARRRNPVGRPRQPAKLASLTERTGLSRRTVFRCLNDLEADQQIGRHRGGPIGDDGYMSTRTATVRCRSSEDPPRTPFARRTGEVRTYAVGRGGCAKGGGGNASKYWPFGEPPPARERPPRRPPSPAPGGPVAGQGPLARELERIRAERTAGRAPPATSSTTRSSTSS